MEHKEYNFAGFTTNVHFGTKDEIKIDDSYQLWVFDENTRPLLPVDVDHIVLPAGEKYKAWEQVEQIVSYGLEKGYGRDLTIVGVGGGVITDMAAFAASIYMRGVKLILIPTTLLSMVDAAFGGKTGINSQGYKNMIGTFYPAADLYIIPEFLQTLPAREFKGGMAEAIKHAFLDDALLLEKLVVDRDKIQARDPETLFEFVKRAMMVKGTVVEQDLREKGIRAHLNLGHTFGHALESVSNFVGPSHGEAVAWGMARAVEAGVELGLHGSDYEKQVKDLLVSYGFSLKFPGYDVDAMFTAMQSDKKKIGGKVKFVLQKGQGQTLQMEIDEDIIKRVLAKGV